MAKEPPAPTSQTSVLEVEALRKEYTEWKGLGFQLLLGLILFSNGALTLLFWLIFGKMDLTILPVWLMVDVIWMWKTIRQTNATQETILTVIAGYIDQVDKQQGYYVEINIPPVITTAVHRYPVQAVQHQLPGEDDNIWEKKDVVDGKEVYLPIPLDTEGKVKEAPNGKAWVEPWRVNFNDCDPTEEEEFYALFGITLNKDKKSDPRRKAIKATYSVMVTIRITHALSFHLTFGSKDEANKQIDDKAHMVAGAQLCKLTLRTVQTNLLGLSRLCTYMLRRNLAENSGLFEALPKNPEDLKKSEAQLQKRLASMGFTVRLEVKEPGTAHSLGIALQKIADAAADADAAKERQRERQTYADTKAYETTTQGKADGEALRERERGAGYGRADARRAELSAEGFGRQEASEAMGGEITPAEIYRLDATVSAAGAMKPQVISLDGTKGIMETVAGLMGKTPTTSQPPQSQRQQSHQGRRSEQRPPKEEGGKKPEEKPVEVPPPPVAATAPEGAKPY